MAPVASTKHHEQHQHDQVGRPDAQDAALEELAGGHALVQDARAGP